MHSPAQISTFEKWFIHKDSVLDLRLGPQNVKQNLGISSIGAASERNGQWNALI
jgi:hypothetical protein